MCKNKKEMNFLHKIESTTNTSCLLWGWPTVKGMDILFSAFYKYCYMVQTSQYLQMQAEETLAQFLGESMVSMFANLCKFAKEY